MSPSEQEDKALLTGPSADGAEEFDGKQPLSQSLQYTQSLRAVGDQVEGVIGMQGQRGEDGQQASWSRAFLRSRIAFLASIDGTLCKCSTSRAPVLG